MSKQYYWWYVYGYFTPGEGNFPHIGQVIRYYRKMCGLEKGALAIILGCTKRFVEMLESDQNRVMPQLLSRRILLAKALHIPPILLGLSSLALYEKENATPLLSEFLEADSITDIRRMAFYEGTLALSWEFYYTSSIERAAKNIDFCFEMLNEEAKETKGVQRDQFDAVRCRFFRLAALIARERMEVDKAFGYINESVSMALHLKNAELIAASLVGRIRIRYQKQQYEQALQDAETACFYADHDLLHDPLKGKCYQMAGEAQAYLAGENKTLQDKSIAYFDKAGRIARKGNLEPDGSFVKTDLTSIYIERAKALRLFRRFREAHNAFAIARKNLSPELTRWQVNLLIEEAKTYLAEGDVTSCCTSLIDALPIVRAIQLQNREEPIRSLLEQCKRRESHNEAVLRLEKAFTPKLAILSHS
jgi:transcriptional regulator with XRE-family HTH domain